MSNRSSSSLLASLPKVELHVHLDGSFPPEELHNLLLARHASDPTLSSIPSSVPLPWSGEDLPVRELLLKCCEMAAPDDAEKPPPAEGTPPAPGTEAAHRHPPRGDAWSESLSVFSSMCTCNKKRSLNKMLDSFALFMPLVAGDLAAIERLSDLFVDRVAASNVFYCEVRYSPHLLCGDVSVDPPLVSPHSVVAAVKSGLISGCLRVNASRPASSPPIVVTQILCMLCWYPQWSSSVVDLASSFLATFDPPLSQSSPPPSSAVSLTGTVVGVDLAAGEAHFDRTPAAFAPPSLREAHLSAFEEAKRRGIRRTCHAGEVPGACGSAGVAGEEGLRISGAVAVERAVREYGAERIGHGYLLFRDEGSRISHAEVRGIVDMCNEKKVHFEVCPTSSFETGGWDGAGAKEGDWTQHPVLEMLRPDSRGAAASEAPHSPLSDALPAVSLSISSDDPAVFSTTLNAEYGFVAESMGAGVYRAAETVRDAIEAAFVPSWAKMIFRTYIDDWFEREYSSEMKDE